MINNFEAMTRRHNANLIEMSGTGYKAIAAAILLTSGINLPLNCKTIQNANKQLKFNQAVVIRKTLLIMRGGKLLATNNRKLINAAAKGVLQ